jgi:hypothetical protein
MIRLFGNEIIEFYCHPNLEGIIPEPKPAAKCMPDWFKRVKPTCDTSRDESGMAGLTVKKCMPVLDVMSEGFIIPLQGDVHVNSNSDCSIVSAKKLRSHSFEVVQYHDIQQIGGKTAPGFPAPPLKFINHWVIKTAPGWSALFVSPINHLNPHFTCLGGLVDTDTYCKEVNFPAIWHTKNADITFKAGTPLVQVIPIKRNMYDKTPKIRKMSKKEFKRIDDIQKMQNSRLGVYTHELRDKNR